MKTLLAVLLLAVVNVAAAGTLTLTLEIYRFAGEAGLMKDLTPVAQLEMLSDKAPEISQTIGVLPDASVRSATTVGTLALKIDALAKPAKAGGYAIDLKVSLAEQVFPVASSSVANAKLGLFPGQRQVIATLGEQTDCASTRWTVMVAGLGKES